MKIYEMLETAGVSTNHLVCGDTSDESKFFSVFGCDSCNHNSEKRLANDIQTVTFTDTQANQAFEFDLCDSCIYDFHYPNELDDNVIDAYYESLSSHIEPMPESGLPCGNNLFHYLQGDLAILYVISAIVAGCESPAEIENWVFTHYPGDSICTNSSLENVAYIAHKLLNTAESDDTKTNIQFGYDCLVQEMTDSLNRR